MYRKMLHKSKHVKTANEKKTEGGENNRRAQILEWTATGVNTTVRKEQSGYKLSLNLFFFSKLFFINSPFFTFSAGFQKSKQTASPEIKPELWTGLNNAQQKIKVQ